VPRGSVPGVAGWVTLTVTLCAGDVPPPPVHESEYVVFAVGDTDCVPEVALVPVQPPLAVQEVLFVDDHVRVDDCPLVIEVGFALRLTVGVGVVVVRVALH
jgi:hypothetical protein